MMKWSPFVKATAIDKTEAEIIDLSAAANVPVEKVRIALEKVKNEEDIYINNKYQVNIRRIESITGGDGLIHLSIKRIDKQPVHDWRELQRIKNELVGSRYEGVELYPAEERLVDSANQYHLFCIDNEQFRFPFGFQERLVSGSAAGGAVQRPFNKESS